MCVAIAKPEGVALPKASRLDNCEASNQDGVGVAWTDGSGVVHIRKDFATNEAMKEWLEATVTPAMACLIHYRMATSGGISDGMRHPFPIVKEAEALLAPVIDCDLALIHNGVIWNMSDTKEKLSDTAMFVRDILSNPAIKDNLRTNQAVQILINGMIGSSNKLALLWPDGHILTFGKFEAEHGVLYSNDQYKTIRHYTEYEGWGFGHGLSKKEKRAMRQRKLIEYHSSGGEAKGLEYCAMCFKQFARSFMYVDRRANMPSGNMVCSSCHYQNRQAQEACAVCTEVYDKVDLITISEFGGQESNICGECQASFHI